MKAMFALWGCVAACMQLDAQTSGYRVFGTAPDAADGDTVKMIRYEGWSAATEDYAVVKDGTFAFAGRRDTAAFRSLYCHTRSGKVLSSEFVLENGDIRVRLTDDISTYDLSGTPDNEAWCAYHNDVERLCAASMELYRTSEDTTLDESERNAKREAMEEADREIFEYRVDFCRKNMHRLAGARVLTTIYTEMNPAEAEELADRIPEMFATPETDKMKRLLAGLRLTRAGSELVDFSMATPEGGMLSAKEVALKSKVLLIDFWASWCGPCRAEMPLVKSLYGRYHKDGLEILGVSLDNDAEAWRKAIGALQLPWLQVSDLKGWDCEAAALYGVTAIPATVLVVDGKIVDRGLRGEELRARMAELFGGS